jgi:hypothetical protein
MVMLIVDPKLLECSPPVVPVTQDGVAPRAVPTRKL